MSSMSFEEYQEDLENARKAGAKGVEIMKRELYWELVYEIMDEFGWDTLARQRQVSQAIRRAIRKVKQRADESYKQAGGK